MPSIKILANIGVPRALFDGQWVLRVGRTVELTDEQFEFIEKNASPKSWEKKRGRKPKAKTTEEAED